MTTLNQTQRIAQVICGGRGDQVSLKRVMAKTDLSHKPAIRIMRKFAQQGLLEFLREKTEQSREGVSSSPKRFPTWKILSRKEICAAVSCPGNNGTGQVRDKIWKAMRIKRIFTIKDICELTDASEEAVGNYMRILKSHSLVRQTRRTGRTKNWQLIMPTPPVKRPNLKEAS